MFERSANKLAVATIASQMFFIRETLKPIGISWEKNEIDKAFEENPNLAIAFPEAYGRDDYEPLSCLHIKEINLIRFEFSLRDKINFGRFKRLPKREEWIILSFSLTGFYTLILTIKYIINRGSMQLYERPAPLLPQRRN